MPDQPQSLLNTLLAAERARLEALAELRAKAREEKQTNLLSLAKELQAELVAQVAAVSIDGSGGSADNAAYVQRGGGERVGYVDDAAAAWLNEQLGASETEFYAMVGESYVLGVRVRGWYEAKDALANEIADKREERTTPEEQQDGDSRPFAGTDELTLEAAATGPVTTCSLYLAGGQRFLEPTLHVMLKSHAGKETVAFVTPSSFIDAAKKLQVELDR